jgi:hypothetical protein
MCRHEPDGHGVRLALDAGRNEPACEYRFDVLRRPLRNFAAVFSLAGLLLAIFDASHHRLRVLPADASPLGVLLGAFVLGVGLSLVEEKLRRRRRG